MVTSRQILIIIFFVIACTISGCSERIRHAVYVDAIDGNDSNPGTRKRPIRTIEELNQRIKDEPADIFFASGQQFSGTLVLRGLHFDKPRKITSAGRKRAVIDGGDREAVIIDRCSGIIFSGIMLKGSGRKEGNTTNGLFFSRSERIRIFNVRAEGFQKSGVELLNCRDAEVRGVVAINNGFAGINIMGSSRDSSRNIRISGCSAINNPGDPTRLDNHSGNGILVGVSDKVIIEACRATRNGWDMPREGNGPVGIWAWESSNVKIRFCASYRNMTQKNAKDGGGFDLDGGVTNSEIEWCISFSNEGAGFGLFQYAGASGWADNTIRHNMSINDATTTEGAGAIFIWNGSRDKTQLSGCTIRGNLVINSRSPIISYENDSEHEKFVFTRNLFIGPDTISGNSTGSEFRKNAWLHFRPRPGLP